MKEERSPIDIGDQLDSTLEQGDLDCLDIEENENFAHLDPENIENHQNKKGNNIKPIDIKTDDELLKEARTLDIYQKEVLYINL